MAITRDLLANIIYNTNNYCCLCLKTVDESDAFFIQDKILCENEKCLLDILRFLLDSEALDILTLDKVICGKCTKDALQSYKFVKTCQENSRSLKKTVNLILSSLPLPDQTSKSLILELKTVSYASLSHFDTNTSSSKIALKSLNPQTKKKQRTNRRHTLPEGNIEIDPTGNICFAPEVNSEVEISYEVYEDSLLEERNSKNKKQLKYSIPSSEMRVDNTGFQCIMCLKTHVSLHRLRQHFLRMHAPKTCKCLQCPRSFGSKGLLTQHVYFNHAIAVCSKCGKSFNNRHTLKRHEMLHTLSKKLKCSNCGRCYTHQKTLDNHIAQNICKIRRKPKFETRFVCDHCNKSYANKASLRIHMQFEHGNRKYHVCQWCDKKFIAKSSLNNHIVKHTKEKNFECKLCGEKFVTKHSLLYHTRIHTGDKPYQCDFCEKRFLSSSRRAEHEKRHHTIGKAFECEICYSKFKIMSSLARHKKRHNNPKSKLYFSG